MLLWRINLYLDPSRKKWNDCTGKMNWISNSIKENEQNIIFFIWGQPGEFRI